MNDLKMKARYFLILAFQAVSVVTVAQTQQQNSIGQVKIASPNAASLGKFVDIPVNYHSGIPTINIPLYTIASGSLQLPISLSYHASGLKVQENASWVGAGWALNAGGVITRTVRGTPDEKLTNSQFQKYGYFSDYGYLSYIFKNDDGTPRIPLPSGQEFYEGRYDGEPDLFFFNFNGYSGKFCFNDDRTPFLMPEQDIKIQYDYTPGTWTGGPGPYTNLGRCIEGFILTTPDGTKYYFGMTGSSPTTPYIKPIEVTSPFSKNSGGTFARTISSWYLNKIVSADGGTTITLSYTRDAYAYYVSNASTPQTGYSGDYTTYDLVKNVVDGAKLSRIDWPGGAATFSPGAVRQDLSGWTAGPTTIAEETNLSSAALGSIDIQDASSFCKRFNFSYSYFTDNTTVLPATFGTFTLASDKKRLKLDNLQEVSCDLSTTIPAYQFEYFTEEVPRTISFKMDHWGFINGVNNADLLPSITKNGVAYITTTNNRESAWPAMQGGTLKKITFPTGGSNTYDYEANTFLVGTLDKIVGGLRIKTITQNDGVDPAKNMVTNYSYADISGHSTSILYGKPVYVKRIRNDVHQKTAFWISSPEGCWPTTQPIFSRNSIQPMESTQGYHLGYSEVKVSQTGNGSSVYRYYGTNPQDVDHTSVAITNYTDGACLTTIPNHPAQPLPNDFKRGEIKYEGHFNEAGLIITDKEFYPVYEENPIGVPGLIFNVPIAGQQAVMTYYELKTARKTSDSVITRNYALSGQTPVQTYVATIYGSPNHHQPTITRSLNSLGQVIEKTIKYSNDYVVSSIAGLTNCNYFNYVNAVNSFNSTYLPQMSSCPNVQNTTRTDCIGGLWWQYIKAISNARIAYIQCRWTNYVRNDDTLPTYQVTLNTAKSVADAELKPILWMRDLSMNAPIETSEKKGGNLLSAEYIKYLNGRNDIYGVYPDKILRIDLATPSPTFTASTVTANNLSISRDSRYTDLTTFNFFRGNVTNVLGRDGVPTSYDWFSSQNFPVVKAINAANTVRDISQPGPVNDQASFLIGPNIVVPGQIKFESVQLNTITVSLPTTPPLSAVVSASFSLTGPANRSGNLCIAGPNATQCTPTSLSYTNMPAGKYTLAYSVSTTFQSFTFNTAIKVDYTGTVMALTGTKEFYYTGFEEAGSGGVDGNAHTGTKFYNSNFNVNWSLPNARSYVIQWWNFANGKWNINKQPYTGSLILTGPVDDIRIYPKDALMNTYTNRVLTGITSEIDPNGRTFNYVYDRLNRLLYVKDQDGNVVKRICYTYNGQTENCTAPAPVPPPPVFNGAHSPVTVKGSNSRTLIRF